MRNVYYNGIPSIVGKSPDQAIKILYDHCHLSGQLLAAVNKEAEELKDLVEQLEFRMR